MKYSNCEKCGIEKTTREQKNSKLCFSCSNFAKHEIATSPTRTCVKCNEVKENTSIFFAYRSLSTGSLKAMCKICDNKRRASQYKNNINNEKNTRLKKTYGICLEEYNDIFEKQGGKCAICNKKPTTRNLAVDHCHKSGKIRGLLCSNCNTALGKFDDSENILLNAIKYLKKSLI